MELKDIIKQMEAGEGLTKSAAAPAASGAKLNAALEKAAGAPAPVARPVDAIDVLMKTANELAGTEKEAEVAHAALCGQAFADGAIAKFAAYDVQTQAIKTAAAPIQPFPVVSDEALVKAAAEAGYQDTIEKLAAEYDAGHDAALQDVHNQAATEFLKGAAEVDAMINLAQQYQQ